MATANKNTFARTYSRNLKPKEEVLPVPSSGEIPIEYENACRLCLEKAPVMMDMFRYQDCLIPIIVKIRSIIALEVSRLMYKLAHFFVHLCIKLLIIKTSLPLCWAFMAVN